MDWATILGLALTVVGLAAALLTVRTAVAVSPGEQLQTGQAFSVPFRITNAAYLYALRDVRVACYAHRVRLGGLTIDRAVMANDEWTSAELDRGEAKTVVCRLIEAPQPPDEADIVLVVDYSIPLLPVSFRRHFRFVGARGDVWQWLQQPANELKPEADDALRRVEVRREEMRRSRFEGR